MNQSADSFKTTGRPYLLVVEDSPTTLAVISRHLAEHFDFVSARDGEEAWQLLQADPNIELVITDMNMPKLSGMELLQRIRGSDNHQIANLPVFVMTTADEDEYDKHEALKHGANDFLVKPINPLVLRARVTVHYKLASTVKQSQMVTKRANQGDKLDEVTDVYNRKTLLDIGIREVEKARSENAQLSLLVVHLDHFKGINAKLGQLGGDSVLKKAATLMQRMVRDVDSVGRMTGAQFGILLPESKRSGACIVAERLRLAIERERFRYLDEEIRVTCSIGMVSLQAEGIESLDELIAIAEKRMSMAKENGHNCICINNEGKLYTPET